MSVLLFCCLVFFLMRLFGRPKSYLVLAELTKIVDLELSIVWQVGCKWPLQVVARFALLYLFVLVALPAENFREFVYIYDGTQVCFLAGQGWRLFYQFWLWVHLEFLEILILAERPLPKTLLYGVLLEKFLRISAILDVAVIKFGLFNDMVLFQGLLVFPFGRLWLYTCLYIFNGWRDLWHLNF